MAAALCTWAMLSPVVLPVSLSLPHHSPGQSPNLPTIMFMAPGGAPVHMI